MGVPYKALNPYLKQFAAFDISSVVTNSSKGQIFAATLMLKQELSQIRDFWDQQVFTVLSGLIESLIVMKHEGKISSWGIRHLILGLQSITYMGDEVNFGVLPSLFVFVPSRRQYYRHCTGKRDAR